MSWRDSAACNDEYSEMFTDDVQPDDSNPKVIVRDALDKARLMCRDCPVRVACLTDGLRVEEGKPPELRWSIRAGFTGFQRHSLEKRGGMGCPRCGRKGDPNHLMDGVLYCAVCGHDRRIPPIPDLGDNWKGRHTKLGRLVVGWMDENVQPGDDMPAPTRLAQMMEVRGKDVTRVYHALVADGTLSMSGNERKPQYRREGLAVMKNDWYPGHLRQAQ